MRESEIKRDMEQHLNVDFGSGDEGSIQEDEESADEVNSNNLGDQLKVDLDEAKKKQREKKKKADQSK